MSHKRLVAFLLTFVLVVQPTSVALAKPEPKPSQAQAAVAVAVAIVELGVKIAQYFADQNKTDQLQVISKQLAEIQNKLEEMDKKLDEVLNELRALKIKVDEIPDMESRKRVNALTAVIVKDFSTWAANPRKYSNEIHVTSLNLEVETENLMSRKTFGNFETVAFAMFLQRSMFVLLQASHQLQFQHYAGFEQYFKDSVSPDVDGSVGREKRIADARLDEITKYLSPGVPFLCQVSGWYHHCCGPGQICDYYKFQDVAGQMSGGYRLVGDPYEIKIAGPGGYSQCNPDRPGDRGQTNRSGSINIDTKEMADAGALDQDRFSKLLDGGEAAHATNAAAPAAKQVSVSTYFAGLFAGVPPPTAPEVYGQPGVAACPAQLNGLKAERDALIIKTESLRQTLQIASKFQGIASNLKGAVRTEMELAE